MTSEGLVRINNYKNKQLYNLYYDISKNEFYVKRSENTNFYTPLRWKHVHRKYINKKHNENKYKIYRYIHFYNPETKEKIRVNETEWLRNCNKIIEDNNISSDINPTDTPKLEDEQVLSPNPNTE